MSATTTPARYPVELSVWLSASFPIGSFAFSHGLEWAAGCGRISDRTSAADWIADVLERAGPRNDAILLAAAWRAASAGDFANLAETNELALALAGSRERYLETTAQGNAFMTTISAAWNNEHVARARGAVPGDLALSVAVGIACASHGMPLAPTIRAYLASLTTNMTSALVRLSVIGQTDAQRIIAGLMPLIDRVASDGERSTLDDIASAAFVGDIAAIAHETQDTRLFRS